MYSKVILLHRHVSVLVCFSFKNFLFYCCYHSLAQSCLILCDPMYCTRLLCPWNPPGKSTGVGSLSFLPEPGIVPASPALACRFFTTEPPGKPSIFITGVIKLSLEGCYKHSLTQQIFTASLLRAWLSLSFWSHHAACRISVP